MPRTFLQLVGARGVSIDAVTTSDAAPAAAPHRISNVAGKDRAVLLFTPRHDGTLFPGPALAPDRGATPIYPDQPRSIIGYRVRLGGVDFKTGVDLGRRGEPCGQEPCSGRRKCSSWSSPAGVQLTEDIDYAEVGAQADGSVQVNVYVNTDLQGWS